MTQAKKEASLKDFFTHMLGLMFAVWVFWLVYCWTMPQIWPAGPQQVLHPGYWLTFAIIWMLRFIRRNIIVVR